MKTMSDPNSGSPSATAPLPLNHRHETAFVDSLISVFVVVCSILAWACAMFVPAWEIGDVSYLFRVSGQRCQSQARLGYIVFFGFDSLPPNFS
jgi:hypothetical protein